MTASVVGGGANAGKEGLAGAAGAGAATPNCSRMSWLIAAELSTPQFLQTKEMGARAISGVMSNEYFVPQEH